MYRSKPTTDRCTKCEDLLDNENISRKNPYFCNSCFLQAPRTFTIDVYSIQRFFVKGIYNIAAIIVFLIVIFLIYVLGSGVIYVLGDWINGLEPLLMQNFWTEKRIYQFGGFLAVGLFTVSFTSFAILCVVKLDGK